MTGTSSDPLDQTWQCKLPVRVSVATNSISSPTALPPFYVLAARQGYVSSISAQIWPLVQHVLPKLPGNSQPRPWLDFRGIPLKSTFPIGVLYDLLVDPSTHTHQQEAPVDVLPWHLTLHYTHAPPDVCVSWLASLPPQTQLLNSLKEACHICKGTDGSSAVMRMEGSAQDALWAAIEKCDVTQYRASLASLKVIPSPRAGGAIPPAIPVRVVLRQAAAGTNTQTTPGSNVNSLWDSTVMTSRPIPALTPSGAWVTLGHALHALIPTMFPQPPVEAREVSAEPQQQQQQGQQQGQEDGSTGLPPAPPPAPIPPPPSPPPPPHSPRNPEEPATEGSAARVADQIAVAGSDNPVISQDELSVQGGVPQPELQQQVGSVAATGPVESHVQKEAGLPDLTARDDALLEQVEQQLLEPAEAVQAVLQAAEEVQAGEGFAKQADRAGMAHSNGAAADVSQQGGTVQEDDGGSQQQQQQGGNGAEEEGSSSNQNVQEQQQAEGTVGHEGSSTSSQVEQQEQQGAAVAEPGGGNGNGSGGGDAVTQAQDSTIGSSTLAALQQSHAHGSISNGATGAGSGRVDTNQAAPQQVGSFQDPLGSTGLASGPLDSGGSIYRGTSNYMQGGPQQPLTLPLNLNSSGATAATAGLGQQLGGVWVCGVQPPLETPLAWLHAHMHAPDYFLYIVIRADLHGDQAAWQA